MEIIDKIKTHIEEHKLEYACSVTAIVTVGITYFIMRNRYSGSGRSDTINVTPLFLGKAGDIVTTIHNGDRGHPGFRIRCLEFPHVDWDTQANAARAFHISPSLLSYHLNGMDGYDNVNGLHFERIDT